VEVPDNGLKYWCGNNTWKVCSDGKAFLPFIMKMLNNVTDTESTLIRE
jgi:hypothetical protein